MNSDVDQLIKDLALAYQLTLNDDLAIEIKSICDALFTSAQDSNSANYLAFLRVAKVGAKLKSEPLPAKPTNQQKDNNNLIIKAFSDGACSGNPGPGGWGAVVVYEGNEHHLSGGELVTTNNRMELAGAIAALNFIKENKLQGNPSITTDSQYVKNGINSWITGWKRNGWLTAAKEPVKNKDLWLVLDQLNLSLKPQWFWVKGHKGHHYNELCDQLAVTERDFFKNS